MPDPNNPNDPNAVPNPNVPGPFRQSVSKGLIRTGFGLMGAGLADALQPNQDVRFHGTQGDKVAGVEEGFAQMGEDLANVLQNRWWTKEFEDFQMKYGQEYAGKVQSMKKAVGEKFNALNQGIYIDDQGNQLQIDDPTSEKANLIRDNLLRSSFMDLAQLDDEFLMNAGKFASNPMINNMVEKFMLKKSQDIAAITGINPATMQQAERNMNIEKAGYYSRLPAPAAGSSKKDENLNPYELWRKHGGARGFAAWVKGNPTGRNFIKEYMSTTEAQIEQELVAARPELVNDPDTLGRLRDERMQQAQNVAVGRYVRDVLGPEFAQQLATSTDGSKYYPQATGDVKRITGRLTKSEMVDQKKYYLERALNSLDMIIREDSPETLEMAIDQVFEETVNRDLRTSIAPTKATESVRKEIKSYLLQRLSNKKAVMSALPIAAEVYGKGKSTKGRRGPSPMGSSGLFGKTNVSQQMRDRRALLTGRK